MTPDTAAPATERRRDPERGPRSTMAEIADALREAGKVVVAAHENPDGDAIGSVRAAELVLRAVGLDVVVHLAKGVVPREYEFVRPEHTVTETPDDIGERVLLCLDSGQSSRLANESLVRGARKVLNVDHHADNTCYGALNVVRGDSPCTTMLVRELARELDVELTEPMATAIYVGLVTDTGRFQYSNTTPESFELAAELVRAGVDVHEIFRQVYERVEWRRLKLLSRGLEKASQFDDGEIVATYLTLDDFAEAQADADSAEGIVDFLRGVEGTHVAVMVRDLDGDDGDGDQRRKGSLRTTRDDIDVSMVARGYQGGGHRQAAGFTTTDSLEQIVDRVRTALREQRAGS